MSRSVWLVWAVVLGVWIASVAWPAAALVSEGFAGTADWGLTRPTGRLLATSLCWAVGVAAGACVLGWLPGRWLGGVMSQRGGWKRGWVVMAPVCVPAYAVFYAWWQSWPADSAVFGWVNKLGAVALARELTLYVSLVCWSWPLVSWAVAMRNTEGAREVEELMRMDRAGRWFRLKESWRQDRRGLGLGAILVMLATLNNTTSFDLAEVFTFANELRAAEAISASPAVLVRTGWPAMVISGAGAAGVWMMLQGRRKREPWERGSESMRMGWMSVATAALTFVLPAGLFAAGAMREAAMGEVLVEFWRLYGQSLSGSVMSAASSAAVGVVVMLGLTAAAMDGRRGVRLAGALVGVTWIGAGLMPGVLAAAALRSGYNHEATGWVYGSAVMVNLGHLTCMGFVAALGAQWASGSEGRQARELRQLEGRVSAAGLMVVMRPTLLAGMTAVFAVMLSMCMGELACTVRVAPPMEVGTGPLASAMLNAMHYQRPQTVLAGMVVLMGVGTAAGVVLCAAWGAGQRAGRVVLSAVAAGIVVIVGGCEQEGAGDGQRFAVVEVFGSPGISPAQFNYPRALAVDGRNGDVYVVDKTARVQRFDSEGKLKNWWRMPEFENGKPTGVSVGPEGNVYVADTHYYRVVVFTPEGKEVRRFGEIGESPGRFIYPTDIAFGADGRMYVSEYGGHDRVQIFDKEWRVVGEFGTHGKGEGEFDRPQAMTFSADGKELFIADSCNHRIVVTDPEGQWVRTLSRAGRGEGELTFPYGVVEAGGRLVVTEFGNNRVQVLDAKSGASIGVLGSAGRERGKLVTPWSSDVWKGRLVILDSGNNRVQVTRVGE